MNEDFQMPAKPTDVERLAAARDEENSAFRSWLKGYCDLSPEELDQRVFEITDRVWAEIDCLSCARCCQRMGTVLTEEDQVRIARRLGLTVDALRERYLHQEDDFGETVWAMRERPCPFLGPDHRCAVYEDRPENCRAYPHLHKKDFAFRTLAMWGRTHTCPAVYEVLEELKQSLGWRPRRARRRH